MTFRRLLQWSRLKLMVMLTRLAAAEVGEKMHLRIYTQDLITDWIEG